MKGPALILLPRQGKGRHGKLPFPSFRQEGSHCYPLPCSQKLEERKRDSLAPI